MTEQVDENQALHMWCLEWAEWHCSRRLFAPPVPKNLLVRMAGPIGGGEPPDAILSANMSYFNLALLGQPESTGKLAMYYYYVHKLRPIKLVAAEMDITTQGFYKALRRVRSETYVYYHRMVYGSTEDRFAELDGKVETKSVDEMAVSI